MRYLNTDLDLISDEDLRPLAAALDPLGMFALHVGLDDDGMWRATFETEADEDEPAQSIAKMLAAVEALPEPMRLAWSRCTQRTFDMGFEDWPDVRSRSLILPASLVTRMAALGASLAITLHPQVLEESHG